MHAGIADPPPPPKEQTPPPAQCMLGDTANKRAVRILLECILVVIFVSHITSIKCLRLHFYTSHGMGSMDVNDTVHTVRLRFDLKCSRTQKKSHRVNGPLQDC